MHRKNHLFYVLLFSISSCTTFYQPASLVYQQYRIDKQLPNDSAITNLMHPYWRTVDATMNKVIGISADNYAVQTPESAIGNFMADCFKEMSEKKFQRPVHLALMNVSGIRSYFSKGNITVGKIYEIMPFDNTLVLQEVRGDILQNLFDKIARDGGWPVSKGTTMVLKNGKATSVLIDGQPLDKTKVYIVANSDYVANGGNDCEMLKPLPQINRGYLMRDAMIEYITALTQQGKILAPIIENRVTNGH